MVLVGWISLSLAPVVALGAPAAGFAALAVGLVAVTTLRFSVVWGAVVAALSFVAYTVAIAVGPVPPWALGPDEVPRLGRSLLRVQTLLPDLLIGLSLAGTAVFAELASMGLEWDLVLRRTVREARDRPRQAESAVEQPRAPNSAEPAFVGAGGAGRLARSQRRPRGKEDSRKPL